MKKLLLPVFFVLLFGLNSQAKVYRFVDERVYSRYFNEFAWSGFSIYRYTDNIGDVYLKCTLSTISSSDCPKSIAPGGGSDPTDETAADYLFSQADASAYDENYNITIYATYQVSGEINARHYKVTMSWTEAEGEDVIQVFERIDSL